MMLKQPRPLVPFTFEARPFDVMNSVGFKILLDARYPQTLWKDTAGTIPVTTSGDAVALWQDRSGNGNSATQATLANRPTYQTGVVNGLPALRFDASDDVLSLASSLALSQNIASVSIVALLKYPDALTTRFAFYFNNGTVSSAARANIEAGRTAGQYGVGGRRLDTDAVQTVYGGSFVNAFVVQSSVIDYANADAVARINGAQIGHSASFQTAGNTSNTPSLAVAVGASSGTAFFGGDMVALGVAIPKLDAASLSRVESYLKGIAGL